MMKQEVAALYVDNQRGPYPGMSGVDPWDEERDAALYAGPHPVVSHPPCGPWSRLAHMCGPALMSKKPLGPLAVRQVQECGGVLEHPRHSRLWKHCGLPVPGAAPDAHGGFTILVEQWWWGHRAVKPTWLYVVRCRPPALPAFNPEMRPPSGKAKGRGDKRRSMLERLPRTQRHLTPPAFAEWLVATARTHGMVKP